MSTRENAHHDEHEGEASAPAAKTEGGAAKAPRPPRASTARRTAASRREAPTAATPSANQAATANDERPAAMSGTAETAGRTATDRAEEVLDQLGQRVGMFTIVAGMQLQRFAARAREEAEDIWAEARQLRDR